MNYYLGVDYHKNYSYCTLITKQGLKVKQAKVKNHKEKLANFLSGYDRIASVLEAGRNWTVMHDWLEDLTDKVSLAHPLRVKAIASARVKTDKVDSGILAQLLRADLIPACYVPGMETREIRQILRQRMFFVRLQTMVKNRILTMVDKYPEFERPKITDLFSQRGLAWMKTIPWSQKEKQVFTQEVALLKHLREQIMTSNEVIEKLSLGNAKISHLKTIPGIGKFLAVLVNFEIGEIERFPSPKKLFSYAGLTPSTYSSGNKTFHGKITKQGNKWLRWAMIEAVWPALRKDPQLKKYYERIKTRKSANSSKVAVARKLLTFVWYVLKEQRDYQLRFSKERVVSPVSP